MLPSLKLTIPVSPVQPDLVRAAVSNGMLFLSHSGFKIPLGVSSYLKEKPEYDEVQTPCSLRHCSFCPSQPGCVVGPWMLEAPKGFCGTVGFNRLLLGAVPLGKADLDPYTQNPLITVLLSFPPLHSTVLTVRLSFLSYAPVGNRIKAPQGQDLSFSVS